MLGYICNSHTAYKWLPQVYFHKTLWGVTRLNESLDDFLQKYWICSIKKQGRQGMILHKSITVMHFISFSTIVFNIAKSLQHIGFFKTWVIVKSYESD